MQEEAKMKEFASFVRVRVREQETLEVLQGSLHQSRSEMAAQAGGEGLASQKAQMYLAYFTAQNAKIRYQQELLHKVDIEVHRKRKEMAFAINRRKIFDKLKEKHLENEEKERRRLEGIQMDEVAGLRFLAHERNASPHG